MDRASSRAVAWRMYPLASSPAQRFRYVCCTTDRHETYFTPPSSSSSIRPTNSTTFTNHTYGRPLSSPFLPQLISTPTQRSHHLHTHTS
ncbi:hypothetical protein K443DRAFT_169414 [Laccaria amethystina LaAM-08-1]|uniref:Uncharacterized protein n=1 Tax=Laccaria amethystina LaAM-08-1 TaxID=1095629 RepID=A0A0C9Y1A4_9AGAR|nr:hypothetical protein K443DRAFT_169414 [Laccaria amethystina LaAM-08-1]